MGGFLTVNFKISVYSFIQGCGNNLGEEKEEPQPRQKSNKRNLNPKQEWNWKKASETGPYLDLFRRKAGRESAFRIMRLCNLISVTITLRLPQTIGITSIGAKGVSAFVTLMFKSGLL